MKKEMTHIIKNANLELLKIQLQDVQDELIFQDKSGNLKMGAGVHLMVLINKAIEILEKKEVG